jgi:hypothetical protein
MALATTTATLGGGCGCGGLTSALGHRLAAR